MYHRQGVEQEEVTVVVKKKIITKSYEKMIRFSNEKKSGKGDMSCER
jgi:hypothetical protein